MLTEIVRLREEALPPDALKSEEPLQRDDAALALFEAALAMGFDEKITNIVNWEDNSDAEDWWEGASWDYLLFPNWQALYQYSDYNLVMTSHERCLVSGVRLLRRLRETPSPLSRINECPTVSARTRAGARPPGP